MCRLVGWISAEPRSLQGILGDAALERFSDLSVIHGNGWGSAVLDPPSGRLITHHSIQPARQDADFRDWAKRPSRLGMFHLRWATPGLGQNLANTHPFVEADRAMIHNGSINPINRLSMLRHPAGRRKPAGTTDSELLFLAVLDELDAAGPDAAGRDLADAFETISDRAVAAGLTAASLNSIWLGPLGMAVLNWHDPAKVPDIDADDPSSPPYYDLRHLRREGLDVVASSGFVSDPQTWSLIPNASVLRIDFNGLSESVPVRPREPLCPVPPAEAVA